MSLRSFLSDLVVDRRILDTFLDIREPNWAVFDPELGYRLRSSCVRDGVDDSWSLARYESRGPRRMIHATGSPCRINTYGDSFTQCHQVSDGETWQEILAAHLGEPIRNYGIGGYGAYQALLRLRTHEADPETSAEYVILNIFDDDHYRSIDRWRWIRIRMFREEVRTTNPWYFHANPWSHLRFDPATGAFGEHPSLCPTPEALYRLADPEFVAAEFARDFVVHCEMAREGDPEADPTVLKPVADALGLSLDASGPDALARSADALHTALALLSSRTVCRMARDFCDARGKKLLVVLSFGAGNLLRAFAGAPRFDASFLDWLRDEGYRVFDLLDAHVRDRALFACDDTAYMKRHFIWGFGHYNPTGNHFCAFALKPGLVDWLDPKPLPYRPGGIGSAGMANLLA